MIFIILVVIMQKDRQDANMAIILIIKLCLNNKNRKKFKNFPK